MMTTSETTRVAQREPITLESIRAIHDQTTWPAIQAKKAERDDLIRQALAAGDLTHAEIVASGMVGDQQLYRIRRGQTSGAQRSEPADPEAVEAQREARLQAERTRLRAELERLGADLGLPLLTLRARSQAVAERLAAVELELSPDDLTT